MGENYSEIKHGKGGTGFIKKKKIYNERFKI
jgi:hypothetical protein